MAERRKLWTPAKSSEILTDCDKDAVILKVQQEGAACHEGYYSCFFRELIREDEGVNLKIIKEKVFQPENVYGEK